MEYNYLTIADVVAMNDLHMASEGRHSTIINETLLESGLMRVQQAAFYEDADLVAQAAYVAVGIAMAHGFEDGNKRTALTALVVFLEINGYQLTAEPPNAGRAIEEYVKRGSRDKASLPDFIAWLLAWVRPL